MSRSSAGSASELDDRLKQALAYMIQIVVQARVVFSAAHTRRTKIQWFSLEMDLIDEVQDRVKSLILKSTRVPIRVDILDVDPLDHTLSVIIETWHFSLLPSPGDLYSLNVLQRLIILIRSIYSITRSLPAYRQFRHYHESNTTGGLQYSINEDKDASSETNVLTNSFKFCRINTAISNGLVNAWMEYASENYICLHSNDNDSQVLKSGTVMTNLSNINQDYFSTGPMSIPVGTWSDPSLIKPIYQENDRVASSYSGEVNHAGLYDVRPSSYSGREAVFNHRETVLMIDELPDHFAGFSSTPPQSTGTSFNESVASFEPSRPSITERLSGTEDTMAFGTTPPFARHSVNSPANSLVTLPNPPLLLPDIDLYPSHFGNSNKYRAILTFGSDENGRPSTPKIPPFKIPEIASQKLTVKSNSNEDLMLFDSEDVIFNADMDDDKGIIKSQKELDCMELMRELQNSVLISFSTGDSHIRENSNKNDYNAHIAIVSNTSLSSMIMKEELSQFQKIRDEIISSEGHDVFKLKASFNCATGRQEASPSLTWSASSRVSALPRPPSDADLQRLVQESSSRY